MLREAAVRKGREVGSKSLQRKAAAGIDLLNPIFAHH